MKRHSPILLGGLIGLIFTFQVSAQKTRTCSENSYSSEIIKEEKISETCTQYEIKVSYDGTTTYGLTAYTIPIPCGSVSSVTNTKNWRYTARKDKSTGRTKLKLLSSSGFGRKGADSFILKFTWCADGSCEKKLGAVSCIAGKCIDYDTLTSPAIALKAATDTAGVNCSSLLASLQKKNATCVTGADGEIEVSIQEGIEPIKYAWSNGATTPKVQNLPPGNYSVTITDAEGNTLTLSNSITSPPPIQISEAIVNPFCSGDVSGSIDLTVSGGRGAFSFLWSNGRTESDVAGLGSGLYTVTVTDSSGCSAQKTFMLTNSTLISATVILKHTGCNQINGGIDITPSGGLAPYTFVWNNGATTEDIQNTGAGNYTVRIIDAAGCSTQKNYTLRVNTALTLGGTLKPVSCLGDTSGEIDMSVLGGVPPYTIKWIDGPVTEDRTGLAAGTYTVTVTDATGCSATANYTIFKSVLQVNSNLVQPKCNGEPGSIQLTVAGVPPYTYTWSNGGTTNAVTDLPPGFYSVTVTDATGCTRSLDFGILSPPPIVVTNVISNPVCGAEGSYAIDLTVSGGMPPYTYLWSNGTTIQDVTGLNSGVHSVAITDEGGCTINRQIAIDPVTAGWSCLIDQPTAPIICSSAGNLLSTSVIDGTSYQWTVSSADDSWAITYGANSSTAVYSAGTAGSTATFTLTINRNGCSQSCTYVATTCTLKDNTGGGDPSSDDPCVTPPPPPPPPPPAPEEPIPCALHVYPNPFCDRVTFEWTAPADDNVRLEILDCMGNRIAMIFNGAVTKGKRYSFEWVATGVSNELIYYKLTTSTKVDHGRLARKH